MAKILELTKKGWKHELCEADLPERTQDLLTKAIHAHMRNSQNYPPVSDEEFDAIIAEQVYFLRLDDVGLILDTRRNGGEQLLFLKEEK